MARLGRQLGLLTFSKPEMSTALELTRVSKNMAEILERGITGLLRHSEPDCNSENSIERIGRESTVRPPNPPKN